MRFAIQRALPWIFTVVATTAAFAAWAAQPELEPGNWKLHVVSTTNGKSEPVQYTEECLGDELKDLGAYFAPDLEGVKAKCKRARLPSSDPRKLAYRTQCAGSGFTVDVTATVTIESSRHFTLSMRTNSKTTKESALVVVDAEARWAGACKPMKP
jgi:hypothetical protein